MASYPALDVRYAPGPDGQLLADLLYAELDPFEPLAIEDLDEESRWRVFFRLAAQRDAAQAALAARLGDRLLALSPVDVDDEDWARRSQAALTAIRVGRIIVAPPWDIPVPNPQSPIPDFEVLVIEPSMGFGTGHHATTRLCLALLQTVPVAGLRVLDVGTGSGVLAIAAVKLGASAATAMDNDPDALQNARENVARNGASGAIDVVEADLAAASAVKADVLLANVTGAVLQRYAAELRHMMEPGGVAIVSGFSPEELDGVVAALGMALVETRCEGEWAAAKLTNDREL